MLVFIFLFVDSHSGLDLPFNYDKLVPFGLMGGARRHAVHHRRGDVNFAPYSPG